MNFMKKLFLSLGILALFTACKKENNATETVEVSETPAAVDAHKLKEYSTEQITELVNTKNDTLYVTNFFATWCGPCVRELPHFTEKMAELKGKPVKFTFISVDEKSDWESKVADFAKEHGIEANTVLYDAANMPQDFTARNFKEWNASSIPFTFMRKGDKTNETVGMMTKEELNAKIKSFQ